MSNDPTAWRKIETDMLTDLAMCAFSKFGTKVS